MFSSFTPLNVVDGPPFLVLWLAWFFLFAFRGCVSSQNVVSTVVASFFRPPMIVRFLHIRGSSMTYIAGTHNIELPANVRPFHTPLARKRFLRFSPHSDPLAFLPEIGMTVCIARTPVHLTVTLFGLATKLLLFSFRQAAAYIDAFERIHWSLFFPLFSFLMAKRFPLSPCLLLFFVAISRSRPRWLFPLRFNPRWNSVSFYL